MRRGFAGRRPGSQDTVGASERRGRTAAADVATRGVAA